MGVPNGVACVDSSFMMGLIGGEVCAGLLSKPTPLLMWRPEETLFSFASRYHHLAGQAHAEHTCRVLFGSRRGGIAHDLPDSIDEFVDRTRDHFRGDARAVIRDRTILPVYLPFKPVRLAEQAICALRGRGIGSLKYRLGMLTSGFRAHHPLKACLQCMAEDVDTTFAPYWHLPHQYPGVWICQKHGDALLQSTYKATGVGRFQWLLPDTSQLVRPTPERLDDPLRALLSGFARAACALAKLPDGFHFDPECLVRTHGRRLAELELTSDTGRLSKHASARLADFLRPLRAIPELASLAQEPERATAQFVYLKQPARALTHPLRHLAHVLWLYGSWQQFLESYLRNRDAPSVERAAVERVAKKPPKPEDARVSRFLELVHKDGLAVSAAARAVGIDTKTGMAWATRIGLVVRRRPKKLVDAVHAGLVAALRSGEDKRSAASRFGVSVETVTTVLRTVVGLSDDWKLSRLDARRKAERRAWKQLRRGNPSAGMKALRWMAPATYAWLYRNDRIWLTTDGSVAMVSKRSNNSSIDWAERDRALSVAVMDAAYALASEHPQRRITLGRLCQVVAEIRPKLRRLDRLPLTREAIHRAIQHRPSAGASERWI